MKIIIDTNLLVAYMFNKNSASARIIGLAEKDVVDVMWHRKIRDEAQLITDNIGRSVPRVKIDLNKVFKEQNEVDKMPKVEGVSEDPADNKFLACAIAARADMIVSNDRHLLDLKSFKGIPIYNSGRALKAIRSAEVPSGMKPAVKIAIGAVIGALIGLGGNYLCQITGGICPLLSNKIIAILLWALIGGMVGASLSFK